MSGVTSCSLAPSHGRLIVLPPRFGRGDDHLHHVGRNGEADAQRAAGAREDRGVDADQPPVRSTSAPPELPGLIAASVWMKN